MENADHKQTTQDLRRKKTYQAPAADRQPLESIVAGGGSNADDALDTKRDGIPL